MPTTIKCHQALSICGMARKHFVWETNSMKHTKSGRIGFKNQAKHNNNPRQALQDAISWNTDIALDPLVSKDAQKLIDQAVATEQARCCSLIFGYCGSDNVAQRTVDAIKKGHT